MYGHNKCGWRQRSGSRWPELPSGVAASRVATTSSACSKPLKSVVALIMSAAPGATAATWSAARAVREGLQGVGFEVQAAQDSGGKRDITLARHAPHFKAPAPPGRAVPAQAPNHALVIGAGLAGACTARALAQQGIACTVIDQHAAPAAEASGNPAGLFHGAVMGHDGPHARLLRAAALATQSSVRDALARGVAGCVDGLLRLERVAGDGMP